MRPPLRSTPPSQPSPYRYLGRGGAERPVRVQIIVALVAALMLVAVPLYLWRRPQPAASIPSADAAVAGAPGLNSDGNLLPIPLGSAPTPGSTQLVPPTAATRLEISPVKTLKCQDPGPGRTPPERCDGVRFFEDGLTRAIRDSASCAPDSKSGFVVSYVLEFHFGKKRTNLYFGKSTTLSKSKRKELLRCVERALPTPDWDRIPHQHQKYTVNTVVTYPAGLNSPVPDASASASPGSALGAPKAAPPRPAAPKPKAKPKTKPKPKPKATN